MSEKRESGEITVTKEPFPSTTRGVIPVIATALKQLKVGESLKIAIPNDRRADTFSAAAYSAGQIAGIPVKTRRKDGFLWITPREKAGAK